jgi:hypothetical protein
VRARRVPGRAAAVYIGPSHLSTIWLIRSIPISTVIACDKREAFAQGSEATKQSMGHLAALWIASLRSQ